MADKNLSKVLSRQDRELLRAYSHAREAILDEIDSLLASRVGGQPVTQVWLYKERRLKKLLANVEEHLAQFGSTAEDVIKDAQKDAVASAATHTFDLIDGQLPSAFTPSFPSRPFSDLVGRLSTGQPLSALLNTFGKAGSQVIGRALLTGVALGHNPVKIAAAMRQVSAMPAARAIVIARTEVMGAYREAARQTMSANKDVVTGWMWEASLGPRTCAACIAQHGSIHPVTESMATHPSCRCTMTPVTKTFKELGIEGVRETRVTTVSGEDWFAKQTSATQLSILGPSKLEAYQQGRITLANLVQRTDSKVWGPGSREASLKDALANAGRRPPVPPAQAWACGSPCRLSEMRQLTDEERKAYNALMKETGGSPIPPAWTEVRVAVDPTAPLQVTGKDAAGRIQRRYSAEHTASASQAKYQRARAFNEVLPNAMKGIRAETDGGSDEALILELIERTGFRIGSTAETGAKVKAYGASTLRAEHVRIEGTTIHFDFIGKEGVRQVHSLTDSRLATLLAQRVARSELVTDRMLFPTASATKVRLMLKKHAGQDFLVKDLRTNVANRVALEEISKLETPTNMTEFKKARMSVARAVSRVLGNKPEQALESYIDPRIFGQWPEMIGMAA